MACNEVEWDLGVEGVEEMDEVGGGGAALVEFSIEDRTEGGLSVIQIIVTVENGGCSDGETFPCFSSEGT